MAEDIEAVTGIVVTSREGRIVELTDGTARLLNITARGLQRHPRTLAVFFDEARHTVLAAQRSANPEPSLPFAGILRPLQQARRPVSVSVRELPDGFLEWTFLPTNLG